MTTLDRKTLFALGLSLVVSGCAKSQAQQPAASESTGGSTANVDGGAAASGAAAGGAAAGNTSTNDMAGTTGLALGGSTNGGVTNYVGPSAAGNFSTCTPIVNRVTAVPPMLMFQIDISGSMDAVTSATNGLTKWAATKVALNAALEQLPPDWLVGVTFFNKGGSCYVAEQQTTVPVAPLDTSQRKSIASAIEAQVPAGNTPTHCAWQMAVADALAYHPPLDSIYVESQRFVVLLTDGVPTVKSDCCSLGASASGGIAVGQDDYNSLVLAIQDALHKNGVRTFVIGAPGAEEPQGADYDPRCMLSEMAESGGTAQPTQCTSTPGVGGCELAQSNAYCHLDLTSTEDFAAALKDAIVTRIGHSVLSCSYPVPAADRDTYVDVKRTLVLYSSAADATPIQLKVATSPACVDGDLYFVTDTKGRVTAVNLCPDRCSQIQGNPGAQLSVQFACRTIG